MKRPDQRTRLTKMLIRKSLTALLSQKPIQSITVKELCTAAGINRGTFYAHYSDIYDLLRQIEDDMLADFQTALEPLLNGQAEQLTPVKITAGIFRCLRENADLCIVTLGDYGDKEFAARLLGLGREKCLACYSAYFPHASREQLEYYYAFVSAGCIGLLEKWLHDGMSADAEKIAGAAESIMQSGLGFLTAAQP